MIHHLKERVEYTKDELAFLEAGAPEGQEPWLKWEFADEGKCVFEACGMPPLWHRRNTYRRRPVMLHAIDAKGVKHKFPPPMRDGLNYGDKYYYIDTLHWKIRMETWEDTNFEDDALHYGLCQATEEGAQMQLAAIRAICRGGDV